MYLPVEKEFQSIGVFDAMELKYGNLVKGPAILEQVNTTTFVTSDYNVLVDKYGSYTLYLKAREDEFRERILA